MTTFDDFWALFPRRVAKRAALKCWEREVSNGITADEIMAGLSRLLPSLLSREEQFIPHPATWLNQGRWEDETPNLRAPPKPVTLASIWRDEARNHGILDDPSHSDRRVETGFANGHPPVLSIVGGTASKAIR